MNLKKIALVCSFVACSAVAGMVGQNLVADAHAPAPSDKTLYDKFDLPMESSMAPADGAAETLVRIVVHAPSAGTAEIHLNSQLWSDFPETTTNVIGSQAYVAQCVAPNTLANQKCDGRITAYFHKPENQGSTDSTYPYSISALMKFAAAGTKTLYLNAKAFNYDVGLYAQNFTHIQAAFTPSHPIAADAHINLTALLPA